MIALQSPPAPAGRPSRPVRARRGRRLPLRPRRAVPQQWPGGGQDRTRPEEPNKDTRVRAKRLIVRSTACTTSCRRALAQGIGEPRLTRAPRQCRHLLFSFAEVQGHGNCRHRAAATRLKAFTARDLGAGWGRASPAFQGVSRTPDGANQPVSRFYARPDPGHRRAESAGPAATFPVSASWSVPSGRTPRIHDAGCRPHRERWCSFRGAPRALCR